MVPTWEHVLRPVLAAAGARWAATGEGVEVEHLLSECVTLALREAAAGEALTERRPVLLACAPEDQHALPLHAVAAGLAERGVASRVLGGSMPAVRAAGGGPPDRARPRCSSGRSCRAPGAPPRCRGRAGDPTADGVRRGRAGLGPRRRCPTAPSPPATCSDAVELVAQATGA